MKSKNQKRREAIVRIQKNVDDYRARSGSLSSTNPQKRTLESKIDAAETVIENTRRALGE